MSTLPTAWSHTGSGTLSPGRRPAGMVETLRSLIRPGSPLWQTEVLLSCWHASIHWALVRTTHVGPLQGGPRTEVFGLEACATGGPAKLDAATFAAHGSLALLQAPFACASAHLT